MTGTLTNAAANQDLSNETGLWLQHHRGEPGDGTANVSANFGSGSRLAVAFGPTIDRARSNTNEIDGVCTIGERISHWSLWTAQSGGSCRWVGNWNTPQTYFPGDTARVFVGTLDIDYGPVV